MDSYSDVSSHHCFGPRFKVIESMQKTDFQSNF